MPLKIAVVCEADADYRTATELAERVLCQLDDWVSTVLENCSLWWGFDRQGTFLCWKDVPTLAKETGIRSHGRFGDDPAAPDAHAARRALLLLQTRYGDLDGVLLIRDDDRQTVRRQGLEQARAVSPWRDRIVIGLAHCKRECWVLAGFDPLDIAEERTLHDLQTDLGFDPRLAAEQLTAKHDTDKRSGKRVLSVLTQDDREREAQCWTKAPLAALRLRGRETGLAEYLRDIEIVIGPKLTGQHFR